MSAFSTITFLLLAAAWLIAGVFAWSGIGRLPALARPVRWGLVAAAAVHVISFLLYLHSPGLGALAAILAEIAMLAYIWAHLYTVEKYVNPLMEIYRQQVGTDSECKD